MKIVKAYKLKLKTNKDINDLLNQYAGAARFVWNKVLRHNLVRLEQKQKLFFYNESCFWLTIWKSSQEYSFLKDCPSQVLQQKLKDLDKAFKDGFDKKQLNKRMPRFKKKNGNDAIRFPQGFKIENNRIFLPKLGWIRFFKSCDIVGTPKNITVSRQAGSNEWYASIQVEYEIAEPVHPNTNSEIGIDMGVATFMTLSDGQSYNSLNIYRKLESKLAKLQKGQRRKKKFSNNWRKSTKKISKLHGKIKNSRNDYLHKTTTQISKNHAIIYVEDLKIVNMSSSASGTIAQPGKNVMAKSGLNKSILDQGWGEARRQLEYKSSWLGGAVVRVPANYTSQKCSDCGHVAKANRKTQSIFCCVDCGHSENADINAAKNIKAAGHAVSACGEGALATSMKQELQQKGNRLAA